MSKSKRKTSDWSGSRIEPRFAKLTPTSAWRERFSPACAGPRANYAQADARFKAGLGTSVELADAEGLRTEAEIQLVLGEFELARARAAFGRTIAEGF